MKKNKEIIYEYGIMSNKHSLIATDKLIAYASMVIHYKDNPGMIVIYSPKENKEDSWFNIDGTTDKKLDNIFGGKGSFEKYIYDNIEAIKKCMNTIKRII